MSINKIITMETSIVSHRFRNWMVWTLLSLAVIPLTYIVSLIVVLLVHGAFGFNQMEGGTYLSQTAMQVAGGAVIGLGTSLYQRALLGKHFTMPASWIYFAIAGFAISEFIICLVLWQMHLNRWQLRFIEFNPLPEALFFAIAGLITGMLQWTILRKYFSGSGYWILANLTGWGICVLVTVFSIWAFFAGALIYGLITGAVIYRVLKVKQGAGMPVYKE
jgi:hypothetical protein